MGGAKRAIRQSNWSSPMVVEAKSCETENPSAVLPDDVPDASQGTKAGNGNRVPPVVLTDNVSWGRISNRLRELRLNFLKAKPIADGIAIHPVTVEDYREIVTLFKREDVGHYTFTLTEDKPLKAVIRGIPAELLPEDVKAEQQLPSALQL